MRRRWAWVAGLCALFGAAALARVSVRSLAAPAVPSFEVRRGPFARRVTAEGYLRAVKATAIAAPAMNEGPLKIAWMAPDGSAIRKGEPVVRFDPTDLEKMLKDGNADRSAAEAKIEKERTQTGAALRDRDRTSNLSQAELEKTHAFQAKDPLIFSRNQIIESQIDEQLSKDKQDHAAKAERIETTLSKSKVELLALERRKAEIAIGQAQKGLAGMEVDAPHDGIVVFETDWRGNLPKVGDTVWAGQRLANIPLLDEMEVEAYVLEADAGGLAAGVPAKVVLESQPEASIPAKIRLVDTLAKPRIRDVPINYFAVTLALERTDKAHMKPGQRVHATLLLDEQAALAVPRQAVFERAGQKVVYVLHGRRFDETAVQLGASSAGLVVVASGLRDGDRIALRDPTRAAEPKAGKEGAK